MARIRTILDDGKRRLTVDIELESGRPSERPVVDTTGEVIEEQGPGLAKAGQRGAVVVPLRRVGGVR
jgi:hypothetical protein